MAAGSCGGDWGSLPLEILFLILQRLFYFSDFISFLSVCQQWRRLLAFVEADNYDDDGVNKTKLHILRTCHNKLPMLLVQSKTSQNKKIRDTFNLADSFIYHLELPAPYCHRFVGSSLGWLMITTEKRLAITLLNPFTRRKVDLPEVFHRNFKYEVLQRGYRHFFIHKGILSSSDPFNEPFEVVVICGFSQSLACYTPDTPTDEWKFIFSEYKFTDVIYFKGRVYAIAPRALTGLRSYSVLVEADFVNGTTRTVNETKIDVNGYPASMAYLVVSKDGELMMVQQFLGNGRKTYWKTYCFRVFVLSQEEGGCIWREIKNLGNQALFVGNNHSVCVSTLEFPMCHSNCIYYTCHSSSLSSPALYGEEAQPEFGIIESRTSPFSHRDPREEHGVFSLEFGRVPFPNSPHVPGTRYDFPPVWIVPNLKDN